MIDVRPITLVGAHVCLVPLSHAQEQDLIAAATDEEVSRYLPASLAGPHNLRRWLVAALNAGPSEVPFAVILAATGRAIGSTRVMDIRPHHDAVEIGHTWYARQFWRTSVNTECKYLLLRHLFEEVGCRRVALKTDATNKRSRRAIERLGAVEEGILRKHMVVQHGRSRDTVYYSILDDEWPDVKERLEGYLNAATYGPLRNTAL